MSDGLKTKIVKIIADGVITRRGYGDIADAIIQDLGLRVQPGFSTKDLDACADDYRYVTDWWPIPCDGKCARYECGCPIPDRDTDD